MNVSIFIFAQNILMLVLFLFSSQWIYVNFCNKYASLLIYELFLVMNYAIEKYDNMDFFCEM